MTSQSAAATLLMPQRGAQKTTTRDGTGLSDDLLNQAARRLRILALLYAFTFFMAAFATNLVSEAGRAMLVSGLDHWLPGTLAIAMALIVVGLTSSGRIPLQVLMQGALVFLVVSNYGIAIAEYIIPFRLANNGWMGLSWVAVWTPLFTVMVPTRPRTALIATLAAVSSVPVVVGTMVLSGRTSFQPGPADFFLAIVFPYLLVAVLAYVGQCVVYNLGKEVTRAQELGSYQLVERLGSGGMGEVWRARHRLLARPAAIKLLRASSGATPDTNAMRRFEREAQVTAQLRSPHTVELWDFGVAADGRFYYVMELLDGLDLDTLVKRHGPLPAERVIFLLRQVCHSLAEAADKGLVHRDIKPANIFLCRYAGDFDFVKVLDFGIVKVTHSPSLDTDLLVTRENVLRGTPAFIAPEQALAETAIDGRADIYAVGCVAYWLLTGQLVFTADTPIGVMLHHAKTAPVPPSERTEMPIPRDLERLILSCLAKSPAERPQSARELSRELSKITTPGAWTETRAKEWWTIHEPQAVASQQARISPHPAE